MLTIVNCPSTLADGFNTYSPIASEQLWDGLLVSPVLDFSFSGIRRSDDLALAMQRISVSGVQVKFSAIIDSGKIRMAEPHERSTHILKPAPSDVTLAARKQILANEHLTMQ